MKTAWCSKHRMIVEVVDEGTVEPLEYPDMMSVGKYGPQLPPILGAYSTSALLDCFCTLRIATVGD